MNKLYKSILSVIVLSIISIQTKAQLAGTYSVPATFSTVAAAINSLNIAGVNGTVTILISAGHTETVPVGGLSLTATGTSTSPIIFQKNGVGANPLLIAYAGGTATPASALQDGVWRLIGSDYITIDGINISDPNAANPATMEFGYGLFKTVGLDGAQNNTIKNCVITLNRINNASGTLPATDGSRGIDVVNATSDAHTSALTPTSAAGSNSNNYFYSNTIQNVNIGISLIGFADITPFTNADQNNDIGGLSALTGNTIINYGGGAGATNPAAGVRTLAQYNLNVSFNTINNNSGLGVNHPTTIRAIYVNAALSANTSINNNTLTIKGGGTTSLVSIIENLAGATAASNTVSINNNLITGCTNSTNISGSFYGIWNTASCSNLSMSNNTFTNNTDNATGGSNYLIYNSGAVASTVDMSNNNLSFAFVGPVYSGAMYNIYNGSGTTATSLTINNNNFSNYTHTNIGTGVIYFIYNTNSNSVLSFASNNWNGLTMNHSGSEYFMYNSSNTQSSLSVISNSITSYVRNAAAGTMYCYYAGASSLPISTQTFSANLISNITATIAGTGTFYGFYNSDGVSSPYPRKAISSNTISNINYNTTGTFYGIYTSYLGDGSGLSGSTIFNNTLDNITTRGTFYGLYNTSTASPNYTVSVFSNTISNLTTNAPASSIFGAYVLGATPGTNFFKNKIYNITSNGATGVANGIYVTTSPATRIYNNIVGGIYTPFSTGLDRANGIYIAGGTNISLFYNTVYMTGSSTGLDFSSNALYASTTPQLNLRNNIFINNCTPTGTGISAAYKRSSITIASYSASSNNNIFYAGTPGPNNLIHYNGTNSYQTLGAFQAAVTPRDNVSQTENSPFLSIVGANANFLHMDPTSPSLAESGAVNIATYVDDFDADIRQGNIGYVGGGTAPDIGADEFNSNVVNCNLVGGAVVTPSAVIKCDAQTATLSASGYTTGAGIVQQWQVSNTPGGPYVNVVGGNGGNYPLLYTTATLSPNTYYYVLRTTCTISAQTAISNEATVTVLAYPTLTVTPSTATLCVPGSNPATLTASGALTYTWLPAAGLNGTVGVSVNALPGATTIYTVTGVNAGGCASVTTTTVSVLEGPSLMNLTATPSIVCSGGNSSLSVLGALTNSYVISGISYSPIPTPSTGVITLCSNSVAVTPLSVGSLNDGAWSNIQIPYLYNFFGVSYNSFAVSTNGNIFLGSGNPNTTTGFGTAFPSATPVRPCIAAVYGNLNWDNPGSIQVFTTGVAPNRMTVVNWTNGAFSVNAGTVTVQAILYETSNIVDIHTFKCSGHLTAVQGIQNGLGSVAYTIPNRNAVGGWTVTVPDAYRFSPNDGVISYSWTPSTYLTGTNIPNPVANTVTASITYSAAISATNGCINSGTISLVADITPTVSIAGTNSICSGNTVNLTANGANTYSWNTGASTSTIAGTPSITISYSVVGTTSLGCTGTAVKVVTVNATPTVVIAGTSSICAGNAINLIASGANTYSWSNGSTLSVIAPSPTTTTTYSVIGTSTAACPSSSVVKTVTVFAVPTVTITAPVKICTGEPVTLISSGTGVDSYSWDTGENTAVVVQSPTVNTTYTVSVLNNNTGCSNTATVSITVDPCVGLKEIQNNIVGLSVYPNPNSGLFTVELNNGLNKTITITDLTGRIVLENASLADKTNLNINNLANGIYYVKVQSNNAIEVFKIVKQ